jgi:hypothetical protein
VPVSVRTPGDREEFGNKVSAMLCPLPTTEPDPRRRVELVAEAMTAAKDRYGALPATILQDIEHFMPPALAARAARVGTELMARGAGRMRHPFNVIISNVPGPQHALYLAGGRVMAHHIVSAIADMSALNISLLSYDGHLDFGLLADRELVPDLWGLMDHIEREGDVLLETAEASDRTPRRARASRSKSSRRSSS